MWIVNSNFGKVSSVPLIAVLVLIAFPVSAKDYYKPFIGSGWHGTIKAACQANVARDQEATDASVGTGIWDKRTIWTCVNAYFDLNGTPTYLIVGHRARDNKWQFTSQYFASKRSCLDGYSPDPLTLGCIAERSNGGEQCSFEANPINYLTGNKFQKFLDVSTKNNSLLFFERYYNSLYENNRRVGGMGWNWRHNYSANVSYGKDENGSGVFTVRRADGRQIYYSDISGEWVGDPNIKVAPVIGDQDLLESATVYVGNTTETYDSQGRLVAKGNTVTSESVVLTYNQIDYSDRDSNDYLASVVADSGQTILFQYNEVGRLESANITNFGDLQFAYVGDRSLQEVVYPDQTREIYHYEHVGSPKLLTGITDRNQNRYVEWEYDSKRRAYISRHINRNSDVVEEFVFDFQHLDDIADPQVTITNPLGKNTTYRYAVVNEVLRVVQVEGHQSTNCAAASKNYSYFPNGQVQTKTDWKNNTTSFQYNTRNLKSSRTEALGTPQERTITTEWHPTFNLRTKITEPGRETNFIYDTEGRLLSQSSNELFPN